MFINVGFWVWEFISSAGRQQFIYLFFANISIQWFPSSASTVAADPYPLEICSVLETKINVHFENKETGLKTWMSISGNADGQNFRCHAGSNDLFLRSTFFPILITLRLTLITFR